MDTNGEDEMTIGPKRKDRRHYSYDEGADEPPSQIVKEPTDIEEEDPVDNTDPVEQIEKQEGTTSPIFEE